MITETNNQIKNHVPYTNWKTVQGSDLCSSYSKDYFFNGDQVTFHDYISNLNLAGNELYRYPELAKALRVLPEYPILQRSYPVAEDLKGMDFIENFYQTIKSGFDAFLSELTSKKQEVNAIISLHGKQAQKPNIDTAEYREGVDVPYVAFLTINGVKWDTRNWSNSDQTQLDLLDIYSLLNMRNNDVYLSIEDAIVNTPFIAVRIKQRKNYRLKGRVVWYDLDSLNPVKLSEIQKHKKA